MKRFTSVEQRIDAAAHRVLDRLPSRGPAAPLIEFVVFGLKQAWACLYGGLLLGIMIASALWWPAEAPIARYDFLFLAALSVQVALLALRLETPREALVILVFHVVGTAMELFKTSAGSWVYPEEAFFMIAGVPLFSGFMYASVGSYLARVTRIFDMRYTDYPPVVATAALAAGTYVNFFSHHFVYDARWGLFAFALILFRRTRVHYRVFRKRHRMRLLVGFFLVSLFIWIAENIATWSRVWVYPGQAEGWAPVPLSKLGAWYLLMIVSFVLVNLVHRPRPPDMADIVADEARRLGRA